AIGGFWTVVPETQDSDEEETEGEEWTDKLFLARFAVPPPLPAPSADYIEVLLGKAFPDHPDGDREAAARAWLWADQSPVPRRAIRFVNDLVALYRQHGDAPAPLAVQAAFLVTRSPLNLPDDARYRLETALGIDDWLPLAAALQYGLPPA